MTPDELFDLLADRARPEGLSIALKEQHGPAMAEAAAELLLQAPDLAPGPLPEARIDREGWLYAIEQATSALATARELATHGVPWAAALAEALEPARAKAVQALDAAPALWSLGRVAEDRREVLGPDALPWCRVQGATEAGVVAEADRNLSLRTEVLAVWRVGLLSERDEASLLERIATSEAWKAAYAELVRADLEVIVVPGGDPALEPELGNSWHVVPLPHLGRGRALEARSTFVGGDWRVALHWPSREAVVLARGEPRVRFEADEVVGSMEAKLDWPQPSPIEEAWRALRAARVVASREITAEPDVARLVDAVERALTDPATVGVLRRSSQAFHSGAAIDESEQRITRLVFEARIELDRAAAELDLNPAVAGACEAIDQRLASSGAAVLALDDEDYFEAVSGRWLDESRWWGERARLDLEVPDELLELRLDEVAAERKPLLTSQPDLPSVPDAFTKGVDVLAPGAGPWQIKAPGPPAFRRAPPWRRASSTQAPAYAGTRSEEAQFDRVVELERGARVAFYRDAAGLLRATLLGEVGPPDGPPFELRWTDGAMHGTLVFTQEFPDVWECEAPPEVLAAITLELRRGTAVWCWTAT